METDIFEAGKIFSMIHKLHTLSHSSGTDKSLMGHHFSNKELLTLTDILQEDATDSLKQIGLDFGDAHADSY